LDEFSEASNAIFVATQDINPIVDLQFIWAKK